MVGVFDRAILLVCVAAGMLMFWGVEKETDEKKKGMLPPRGNVERAIAAHRAMDEHSPWHRARKERPS